MRIYYTIAFLLVSLSCSFAQNSPWTFGVKAGIGKSGSNRTVIRDIEVRDEYQRGNNYSIGLRTGYRFLKYFTATADIEFQQFSDERLRVFNFNAENVGRIVNTTQYDNEFQRVQLPVALQFSPFTKGFQPYLKAGIMPFCILKGSFDNQFRSSVTGIEEPRKLKADFDLLPNRKLDRQMHFFAGFGIKIGRHLSVEAVRYFAGRMDYVSGYSQFNKVLYPTYSSYALRGTQLSLTYHIW
ncbi:outer membrane beta-barrel protein [Dyadobacter aurulentus]|uniref:outer membrane beta-barrel protein n=1 Tax=Dyadobacter sp. UC 10 TaxID=2605428 RepID=UPI0011F324E8|nr:outer membrane beta-barrel protein [Dyadobacter sp. UC 10]KAA0989614.1 PorT family protein [Dyadobacter sp. UC 10]